MRDFAIIFFVVATIISGIWFMQTDGTITIQQPYLEEYTTCQSELNAIKERDSLVCSPTKCDCGSTAVTFTIFGVIMWLVSIVSYFYTQKNVNKAEEKLKKIEEEIKKKENALINVATIKIKKKKR
jgi:hypothetical protein